ncbi:MAG: stage II sporulation protein M [Thaumarchaeota archaeon]|nr:stage II sporulation protein M [Nitrososphaerota archaeon]
MNFCPSCGEPCEPAQNFCKRCRYELRARAATEEAVRLPAPVYAMEGASLYVMDDWGVTRVSTRGNASAVILLLVAFSTGIAAVLYDLTRTYAPGIVLFLILAPVADTLRYRRLRSVISLPRESMLRLRGSWFVPWAGLTYMTVKGRRIRFMTNSWRSATIDPSDIPSVAAKGASALGRRFFSYPEGRRVLGSGLRRFWTLVIIIFVLDQALLVGAAVTPFFPGEKEAYLTLTNSQQQGIASLPPILQLAAIFSNNAQVALLTLIPGLGLFTFAASTYNTGRVIQVIADRDNVSSPAILFILFLLPHSWVEELSYPLAAALSLYYLTEWRRPSFREFSDVWKRSRLSVATGLIAVTLAFAAALEVTEPLLGASALLLWGMVFVAVAVVRSRSERFKRLFS